MSEQPLKLRGTYIDRLLFNSKLLARGYIKEGEEYTPKSRAMWENFLDTGNLPPNDSTLPPITRDQFLPEWDFKTDSTKSRGTDAPKAPKARVTRHVPPSKPLPPIPVQARPKRVIKKKAPVPQPSPPAPASPKKHVIKKKAPVPPPPAPAPASPKKHVIKVKAPVKSLLFDLCPFCGIKLTAETIAYHISKCMQDPNVVLLAKASDPTKTICPLCHKLLAKSYISKHKKTSCPKRHRQLANTQLPQTQESQRPLPQAKASSKPVQYVEEDLVQRPLSGSHSIGTIQCPICKTYDCPHSKYFLKMLRNSAPEILD